MWHVEPVVHATHCKYSKANLAGTARQMLYPRSMKALPIAALVMALGGGVASADRFHGGGHESFHGGAQVYLFPYLMLAGGYTFSKLDSSKWNEFALEADYLLSKRTDVYLSGNYEKASGDGTRAVLLTETGSSNDKQLAVRIGLRQRF